MKHELLSLIQISDSAFPVGSLSHSNGYEAACQFGYVKDINDLRRFAVQVLENASSSQLPFLRAAWRAVESSGVRGAFSRLQELRDLYAAGSIGAPVALKASTSQGANWVTTCKQVFGLADWLADEADCEDLPLPVAQGAVGAALGLTVDEIACVYLQGVARSTLSAAVREGSIQVGCIKAQQLQHSLQLTIVPQLLSSRASRVPPEEAATSAYGLPEVFQESSKSLNYRLFAS